MGIKTIALSMLILSTCLCFGNEELLGDTDGAWSLLGFNGYAGEVLINPVTGSSYFYWLFEAVNGNILTDKRPIIIWLQGGPGCSGETGILFENIGPFYISNSTQPTINPYAWNSEYHVMSIDFPLGAGFSYHKAHYDMKNTTAQATAQLYNLLVKLSQKYPTWFNRDLYFFGESYAGHWIPGIAYTILMNNKAPGVQTVFNLKGVGMGDPWTEAYTQLQSYGSYSYQRGLIDMEELQIINTLQQQVLDEMANQEWDQANNDLNSVTDLIVTYAGGINVYDIRSYETNYNLGQIPTWLGLNSTKNLLHVPLTLDWDQCSGAVNDGYNFDTLDSMSKYLPLMLDSIKVMVYNGADDLICESVGTLQMLDAVNWPGIGQFINSPRKIWRVNGQIAGYANSFGNLSFVIVLRAGHMVPHDQPQNGRDLVYRFINNEGWQ
ncbi:unnamed protein product [Blepharisma stoltei]|uniref:Carboxypeptidase n=1 Tax=Blepharisma stoltei TaxID=1481888 RepID=A0AAU9KDF0_9CILI|nr:unnamed protein product [Blepharisma stoltei]